MAAGRPDANQCIACADRFAGDHFAALDGAERLRAARLRAEKYLSAAWTLEGRASR